MTPTSRQHAFRPGLAARSGPAAVAVAVLVAFMAVLALARPALAENPVSGIWEGEIFGSRLEATIVQNGEFLSGVVSITPRNGKRDIYHVQGAVFGTHVVALHGAGHVFEGDLVEPDRLTGVLTTKGGTTLTLTATRRAAAVKETPPAPNS